MGVVALVSAVLAQEAPHETALAALIKELRDDAVARGVNAAPAEIHAALSGYVPSDVLASVRWRIDSSGSLAGMSLFRGGAIRAVTLDNVIVFANADEAANLKLWAHEIYHVMQYREWGVDGFAVRYLEDRRTIEHEAREFRWRWMKATSRVPQV